MVYGHLSELKIEASLSIYPYNDKEKNRIVLKIVCEPKDFFFTFVY